MSRSAGRSAMPHMVVKIVGGKQIKHFIDPNRIQAAVGQNAAPLHRTEGALPKPGDHAQGAGVQVPDRLCVTAPSGDGSQSYRHRRSPAGNYTKAVQPQPQVTGRELQEGQDVRVEDWLILQASAELKGWKPHTLENIDEEFAPLDPSHMGTIHQSELTYLFLRRQVPLKLPTMASLLHTFSCSAHPEQVLYEKLLQFIQSLLPGQVAQSIEEIYVAPSETETWPQRFQKLESALHMCDSRNTGCIEKEQAQCLIESYNLTFDLGLSPLRVNEVIRKAQLGGRVHLATALLLLKNR